jgi:2-succinyl-5-enolpyruvyl-6-hydroxy-3-cyclohexene-1-carboxylate synthase
VSARIANTVWARAWAEELARAGVGEVAVAPGSRSTPLVLALARDSRFRLRVHLDERSAGFFALGIGKATGRPAAVVTTSGSAVANLLPAVVEASQAETPLLVLTADRPPRLRGADANQAIHQAGLFGSHVRASFESGPPSTNPPDLRHLRALASRAVDLATGPPAGAVHVNFPFDKPLEPSEDDTDAFGSDDLPAAVGRPDNRPYVATLRGRSVPTERTLERLAALCATERGLIVAGPNPQPWRFGPAVLRFAARSGFPVLADPLSGARFGPDQGALRPAAYDFVLRSPEVREALRPSVIIRVGSSPTSAALQETLVAWSGVDYLVIDEGGRWKDHGATATEYLVADPVAALEALGDHLGGSGKAQGRSSKRVPAASAMSAGPDPADGGSSDASRGAWTRTWAETDVVARGALPTADEEETPAHEGAVWPRLAEALPEATVFVSNSMPVRDLDGFALPDERPWTVLGNRGASGIDGIVSTAFGVAATSEEPVVCVLGDLALFHDQNGLLWAREEDLCVVFVLVDNDGGGIFHGLPIAEHEPEFTRFFATPHGLDFSHAAALHGIELRDVTPASLASEVADAARARRTTILRLSSERVRARARREDLAGAVARAARLAVSHHSESDHEKERPK